MANPQEEPLRAFITDWQTSIDMYSHSGVMCDTNLTIRSNRPISVQEMEQAIASISENGNSSNSNGFITLTTYLPRLSDFTVESVESQENKKKKKVTKKKVIKKKSKPNIKVRNPLDTMEL